MQLLGGVLLVATGLLLLAFNRSIGAYEFTASGRFAYVNVLNSRERVLGVGAAAAFIGVLLLVDVSFR